MRNSLYFMGKAIELAKTAGEEVPVAALIVQGEQIIASSYNQVIAHKDPTQHAELIVIKQALQKLESSRLTNCNIYVTLEPCAMCAAALALVRINAIYFAAYDEKMGAIFNGPKIFASREGKHKLYVPKIYCGISEEVVSLLLKEFFAALRL